MTPQQEKAKELIEKAKKASSFQYQESAVAHCNTFEHDIDTLILIALLIVEEVLSDLRGNRLKSYLTVKQCVEVSEFWEGVKDELYSSKNHATKQ